jgi:hypothetical protein
MVLIGLDFAAMVVKDPILVKLLNESYEGRKG